MKPAPDSDCPPVEEPPNPASRVMFFATVTDDAIAHFVRLGRDWKAAITADPAYAPSGLQVAALQAHGWTYAWGNQEQIGGEAILNFMRDWRLNAAIFQAETSAEYGSAMNYHPAMIVGNPNAWTPYQRDEFIAWGDTRLIGEVYNGRPDTYSSQGVPVASFCLGVAMDDGLHYPLAELAAKSPDKHYGVWHAAGLTDADWAVIS